MPIFETNEFPFGFLRQMLHEQGGGESVSAPEPFPTSSPSPPERLLSDRELAEALGGHDAAFEKVAQARRINYPFKNVYERVDPSWSKDLRLLVENAASPYEDVTDTLGPNPGLAKFDRYAEGMQYGADFPTGVMGDALTPFLIAGLTAGAGGNEALKMLGSTGGDIAAKITGKPEFQHDETTSPPSLANVLAFFRGLTEGAIYHRPRR